MYYHIEDRVELNKNIHCGFYIGFLTLLKYTENQKTLGRMLFLFSFILRNVAFLKFVIIATDISIKMCRKFFRKMFSFQLENF